MLLSTNDDVTLPGTIVCLDVQTIPEPDKLFPHISRHRLRCWSAVAGRIEYDKWTREKQRKSDCCIQFWEWLNSVRMVHRPIWIFSRDMVRTFTVLGLWTLMESGEFRLNRQPTEQVVAWRKREGKKNPRQAMEGLLIDSPRTTAVVFYHKSGWKVVATDAANYFTTCDVTVASVQQAQSLTAPSPDAPIANWLSHSSTACDTLRNCVVNLACWHRKQELGRWPFSVAGMALAAFRHRFMHIQPNLPEDQDERDFEREAYYQGRVEPFWVGTLESGIYSPLVDAAKNDDMFSQPPPGAFHLVDARSMYGAVGVFCELPYACIGESEISGNAPDLRDEQGRDLLATVTLSTPHGEYPYRRDGRLMFVRGEFTTTLAGPELHRAVKDECITRWHRWRRYEMGLLFRPFSLALWDERLKQKGVGNETLEGVCKQLLARLHGKFIQRATRWENRPELFADKPWDDWWNSKGPDGMPHHYRSVGWDVQEEMPAGDAPHCFPAIAAWVSSWAREWLRSWILLAGEKNVLYVATDSMIVTDEGRVNLERAGIIGDYGIGSMRVVQTSDNVRIRSVGNYQIGTKRAHGGQTENAGAGMDSLDKSVQLDSLATVLFLRRGREIQSTSRDFNLESVPRGKKILAGGWLETPCLKIPKSPLAPVE